MDVSQQMRIKQTESEDWSKLDKCNCMVTGILILTLE